jgi:hypothetical protein
MENIIENELIQVSRKLGFSSRDNLIGVNQSYYYLWMTELQKWLRDTYHYEIVVSPVLPFRGSNKQYTVSYLKTAKKWETYALTRVDNTNEKSHTFFSSHETALEAGLHEVINILKKENGTQ